MNTEISFTTTKGAIQEQIDKSYSNIVLSTEPKRRPRKRYRITEDQFNRLIKNLLNEHENTLKASGTLTIAVN